MFFRDALVNDGKIHISVNHTNNRFSHLNYILKQMEGGSHVDLSHVVTDSFSKCKFIPQSNVRQCVDGEFYPPSLLEMELVPEFQNVMGYMHD